MYQPEIGRMLSIDAHAFNYYQSCPYAFVLNNPILYSDPTGMDTTKRALIPTPAPAPTPTPTPTPAPPPTVNPPTVGSGPTILILFLAILMQGDTDNSGRERYWELLDKEDTHTLSEEERQELESLHEKYSPYNKKSKEELLKSKKSFESLVQEHVDKLDEYKCDPDKNDKSRPIIKCISGNKTKKD
jgi:hypothetical protein